MADTQRAPESDLESAAPARRTIYEFLAGCFLRVPTPEQAEAVRSGRLRALCADGRGSAAASASDAESVAELEREFMDLFKVPGAKYLTPFESVYRDRREIAGRMVGGLLMGPSAVDVQQWYRLAALDLECKELPDHIGVELAYLAHLCQKELDFAAAGDGPRLDRARQMQRDFLAAHVDAWLGALRDKLYEKSTSTHYRTIADFAVGFVRADLASLEQELGPAARSSAPTYQTGPAGASPHAQA